MESMAGETCKADDNIDDSWIEEFKNLEKDYDDFYKDTPNHVNLCIFFVDKNNELDYVKQENIRLDKNSAVTKHTMVGIINKNKQKNYSLQSILKYNFTVEPTEINSIITNRTRYTNEFLSDVGITDIVIKDTIHIFHDINSIYIFLKENNRVSNNTKKNYVRAGQRTRRRY